MVNTMQSSPANPRFSERAHPPAPSPGSVGVGESGVVLQEERGWGEGAPPLAIATTSLTRRYGTVTALDGVSLAVPAGTIHGFLGPNGAGKTTTIRILLGFIRATSGSAAIFGHNTWSDGVTARRSVGYLVGADSLYPDMTGAALLDHAAGLSNATPV
ncbi:MAG: ATP-binding cassette domain-containing protein, partial [Thermomicrobiales bacterium]